MGAGGHRMWASQMDLLYVRGWLSPALPPGLAGHAGHAGVSGRASRPAMAGWGGDGPRCSAGGDAGTLHIVQSGGSAYVCIFLPSACRTERSNPVIKAATGSASRCLQRTRWPAHRTTTLNPMRLRDVQVVREICVSSRAAGDDGGPCLSGGKPVSRPTFTVSECAGGATGG